MAPSSSRCHIQSSFSQPSLLQGKRGAQAVQQDHGLLAGSRSSRGKRQQQQQQQQQQGQQQQGQQGQQGQQHAAAARDPHALRPQHLSNLLWAAARLHACGAAPPPSWWLRTVERQLLVQVGCSGMHAGLQLLLWHEGWCAARLRPCTSANNRNRNSVPLQPNSSQG